MRLENVKLNLETELVLNVGDPISKTNAPRAYNKLFELLDMNAIMLPCEIKKGELPEFLKACKLMGIHYLAPTMPHKGDFVDLLDDVDETSRLFHSVNAVRLDSDGTHGAGMDGRGAVTAMLEHGAKLDGIDALLYGSGGITGVTACELARSGVRKIYITNRTLERAESTARIIRDNTPSEVEVIKPEPDSLNKAAESCKLFANLTPLGMAGFAAKHDYLGFIDRMPTDASVFDSVINPPMSETIERAKANNLNTIPGMYMLVAQMDLIFNFLFKKRVGPQHKEACIEELCNFLNVVRP
ncbi:MAG: hypothetical protein IJT58_01280 [Synergistaceae bacterium]|nr:hypothetical protein [Synergistaceae bacterium]